MGERRREALLLAAAPDQARLKTLFGFHLKHCFHYPLCSRYVEQQGSRN